MIGRRVVGPSIRPIQGRINQHTFIVFSVYQRIGWRTWLCRGKLDAGAANLRQKETTFLEDLETREA